jgi:hypothetical protein
MIQAMQKIEPHMIPRLICFTAPRMRVAWLTLFCPDVFVNDPQASLKTKMGHGPNMDDLLQVVDVGTTYACFQQLAGYSAFVRGVNDNQRMI